MSKQIKSTLTYGNKSAELGTPEGEKLVEKFVRNTIKIKGGKMPEVNIELKNIRNVEIKSRVVEEKDKADRIVTAVRFEYDGEPSAMEKILLLEAQGQPVSAWFNSPQLALELEEKSKEMETVKIGIECIDPNPYQPESRRQVSEVPEIPIGVRMRNDVPQEECNRCVLATSDHSLNNRFVTPDSNVVPLVCLKDYQAATLKVDRRLEESSSIESKELEEEE